jgi:hypothetical protein
MAKGKKTGGGSRKGVPNRVTVEFRETVQQLLDDNRENVKLWLTTVAADDPARALDLLAKLAEYAAPKLGRMEHTGAGGGPVTYEVVSPFPVHANRPG